MKESVIITGVAGFLGSHVARHCLDIGLNVIGIDDLSGGFRDNIPREILDESQGLFIQADICETNRMNHIFWQFKPKYVYHLAAYAAEQLSPHIKNFNYMNNVVGSMNIINACVNNDVKCLVFTSSIAVMSGNNAPYTETDPFRPEDSYGTAKMVVEYELHQTLDRFGLNFIVFRPYNIFGERQNLGDKYRNVVGIFMNQVMQGKPMTIFGDGEQQRAFSYIDDVAPHIAKSVLRPEIYNNTFFIGGSRPYSVNYLASIISEEFGVEHRVQHLAQRTETKVAYAVTTKSESAFGPAWTDLRVGVRKMAEWARAVGARESKEFDRIEIRKNLPEGW